MSVDTEGLSEQQKEDLIQFLMDSGCKAPVVDGIDIPSVVEVELRMAKLDLASA